MPVMVQAFEPKVVLKSATPFDRLNLMTLWNSPLMEVAGATTSVPAPPKFSPVKSEPTGLLDEPVARKASAEVVVVKVTAAFAQAHTLSTRDAMSVAWRFTVFVASDPQESNRRARASTTRKRPA